MNTLQKNKLYILSLALLFVIIAIITAKLPEESFSLCNPDEICAAKVIFSNFFNYFVLLLKANIIPIVMLFLLAISWYFKYEFDHLLQGGGQKVIRIQSIENEDYEHLTFLATYIIPFFGFKFNDPNQFTAIIVLLVIIGAIFVRTNKYYANPTLAVLGYRLYKATLNDKNGVYESIV
ncbi:hypothetical protein QNE85_004256, partial [Vibrio fluvialis]|nr:hypothetical protein [Vibrio fluvialis]